MSELDQLKETIQKSSELSRQGKDQNALALLDNALTRAFLENKTAWIRTLSHHAAAISDSIGDVPRVRRYYEQALICDPNSSKDLYGLANALQRQGESELAKLCATKCYQLIRTSENDLDQALLELVLLGWPELT